MKKDKKAGSALWGLLFFFLSNTLVIQTAVLVFSYITKKTADNGKIAIIMMLVSVALSLLFTLIDYLRRKHTVDKPVREILDATERIAKGDFSVRLNIEHDYGRYNQYDFIKENINALASELGKSEMMKSDFISSVSHELKTPLSVVENYATLLLDSSAPADKRKEYLQALKKASHRLTTLVSNILKLNKLENSVISVKRERFNLTTALGECVLYYEDKIEEKGIELECDLEDISVVSNREYLDIVWTNLVSNAVKFTESGGKVSVSLKRKGDRAEVCVEDTGCGIGSDEGERIFEKFYQVDGSRASEGNGLGLALVKKVIDLLGGEISVSSEINKGTVFTVSIAVE